MKFSWHLVEHNGVRRGGSRPKESVGFKDRFKVQNHPQMKGIVGRRFILTSMVDWYHPCTTPVSQCSMRLCASRPWVRCAPHDLIACTLQIRLQPCVGSVFGCDDSDKTRILWWWSHKQWLEGHRGGSTKRHIGWWVQSKTSGFWNCDNTCRELSVNIHGNCLRNNRKLVDNFIHKSDVTSLQDLFTSCPSSRHVPKWLLSILLFYST